MSKRSQPGDLVAAICVSPATRAVMQANRATDTQPEVALRSALHRRGLRFRKNTGLEATIRCRADVVFATARVAVFVDGCFWHEHPEGAAAHVEQIVRRATP